MPFTAWEVEYSVGMPSEKQQKRLLISDIYKRADAIAVSALKLISIVCLSKDDALRFFVSSKKKELHKLIICNRLIVDSVDRGCRCRQTRALLTEIKSNKSLISHYFSLVLDVVLLNGVEWTFLSLAAFFVHHQRIRSKIFIFGYNVIHDSVWSETSKKFLDRQQNIKTHKWGKTGNVAAHSFLAFSQVQSIFSFSSFSATRKKQKKTL